MTVFGTKGLEEGVLHKLLRLVFESPNEELTHD